MTTDDSEAGDDFTGTDIAVLKDLRDEARETIEQQVDTLDDVDAKASKVLRLNVLIISAVLTIVSIAVRANVLGVGDVFNPYTVVGIVSLVLSTAFGALTYTATDAEVGIAYRGIRDVLGADYSPERYYEELAHGYANWIEFNDRTILTNAPLITATTLLVTYGISFLAVGVAAAVTTDPLSPVVPAVVVLALVAITYVSGIVGQVRRWREAAAGQTVINTSSLRAKPTNNDREKHERSGLMGQHANKGRRRSHEENDTDDDSD